MADSDVRLKIIANTAQLSSALQKARAAVGTQTNAMAASLNKVKMSFTGAVGGITRLHGALASLGVVLSAGAIAQGIMNLANMMDRLEEASQKTGVGVESLQIFGMAAKLASVDSEALTRSLAILQRRMFEYTEGLTEPVTAFNALSVAVKDASGELKLTDDVFLAISDRFAEMPDGAEKGALAMKLFGRSGAELIPILNMGSAGIMAMKEQMGYLFTQEDATRAAVFTDNIDIMKRVLQGTGIQIMSGMLPAMVQVTESFKEGAKEGDGLRDMGSRLGGILLWVAEQAWGAAASAKQFGVSVMSLAKQAAAIWNMKGKHKMSLEEMRAQLKPIQDEEKKALDKIKADYDATMKKLHTPVTLPPPRKTGGGAGYIEDETTKTKTAAKEAKSLEEQLAKQGEQVITTLMRQIALTGEVSKAEAMRWDTTYGQYANLSEFHKQRLIELSEEIDMIEANKEREKEATEAFEEARKNAVDKANEKMREIESILESIKTPQDQYNKQVKRLNELLAEGALTWDTYQAAMAKAKETVDEGKDKFTELKQVIEGWGKQSADAIVDFCMTGKTSFTDMINSMIADLLRMIVYQNLTGPLASGISSLISGGTFSAGWTSFKRASGGPVSSGGMYEVNERGIPELLNIGNRQFLMMADQAGSVAALKDAAASGGGAGYDDGKATATIVNYNITAMDYKSMQDVFRRNAAIITQTIDDSLKSNSGLRNTIKRTR